MQKVVLEIFCPKIETLELSKTSIIKNERANYFEA